MLVDKVEIEPQSGPILILGGSSMVGSRFVDLYSSPEKLLTPRKIELDITDKEAVQRYLREKKPATLIIFSAFTNVNDAEKERGEKEGSCWQTNVVGIENVLNAIDPEKTDLIYFSTDYVFSGRPDDPGPYKEDHKPESDSDKLTWYGFTKAEGERRIRSKLGDNATIVRIISPVRAKFPEKLDYLRNFLRAYDLG